MADSEDDYYAVGRSQAGVDEQDDAVDDAAHVRILHYNISQWAGCILDCLQRSWNNHSGICHGLDAAYRSVKIPRPRFSGGCGRTAACYRLSGLGRGDVD